MKSKLWKEIVVAVLLISTILSFSPIAYGKTTSLQNSIDAVKMEMKQAALAYVEPALKGEQATSASLDTVLNSVKKNYEATRSLLLASNLSETEKQTKLKELEALYEEKIIKGLIPYIDAYNYATKYLDPLLKEIKEAEAKNDFLAVEKAYHKLSVQLKSRTSILYRFTGKAARDLLLEKYKKPADVKRDELIVPVTIIMKATNAQLSYQAGKKEEVKKAIIEIQALAVKLSSTNPFHQAVLKELERLQALIFPAPVNPVVPTQPSTGGGGGSSETSAQRALRLAKADATKELQDYKVNVKADYSSANWAEIEKRKATGVSAINSAKTPAEATQALANAKTAIDQVPVKSGISTISGITVKGEKAIVDPTDPTKYNVELPVGTNPTTLTHTDIIATTSDPKANIGQATTTDNGTTWLVVVTSEDGKSSTTYSIKVTVKQIPIVNLTPDSLGTAENSKITNLTPTTKYVVTDGSTVYGVLANGTRSTAQSTFEQARRQAEPLTGTEITGLTNGSTYKVEIAPKSIKEQFPDPALAQAIAKWMGKTIDDGITKVEINDRISRYNDYLDLNSSGISRMDGFEIFNGTQLRGLSVALNGLQSLDVSGLSSLETLLAGANPLANLNISGLTSLRLLTLEYNRLSSLDLSSLDNLLELRAYPLTGDKIKSTDSLELSYYHLKETLVAVGSVSGAVAGDGKITGLVTGTKYVVKHRADYYGVLADGTLSAPQTSNTDAVALAVPLTGTEITGFNNGWSYKVVVAP